MNSALSLTLILMGSSCLYLFAVAYSFRLSHKRSFSPPWLLLPLFGATITGISLVFSVPVLPASTIPVRLLELLAHLFNILLIWTITSKIAPERRLPATLLYAWNPLALIELTVYANNAGVVMFLLLLAIAVPLVVIPSSPTFRRGGGGVRYPRHVGTPLVGVRSLQLQTIAALVLIGLAVRINFMTLLLAPLWLWFMARHMRGVARALTGFAWRALVVLAVFIVAYLPAWQGSATFLAITDALNLFNFANSPLSLVVMPARSLFKFVAQNGHFPPSLMQPATAADMTVLATSLFLFALLYLREMGQVRARLRNNPSPRPVGTRGGRGVGWGPCACPAGNIIRTGSHDPQQIAGKGTERGMPGGSQLDEDKHKAPSSAPPRPLSLQDVGTVPTISPDQDDGDDSIKLRPYDTLFTAWAVVFLGYTALAVTVFWPGYIVWGVWIVALRRFDALSVCALLLSCSALLYYPLQQLAAHSTGILLPVCVFGIPLVYLVVQHYIPPRRVERKNVLT
ncbi:MAG TPA: hypothetical protein VFQ36_15590 [Ktedonobacteraceae bacterium]|nr:hypothetical protein [Ktedonobacteraceae bacterium]